MNNRDHDSSQQLANDKFMDVIHLIVNHAKINNAENIQNIFLRLE